MQGWALIAAAGLLVGASSPQAAGAAGNGSAGVVALMPRPVLRHDMQAFPRVEANAAVTAASAAKINASLTRLEKQVLADAKDCRKSEGELESREGGGEFADDWTREVTVTMQGPRYLSLVAEDSYSCGGPHPDDDRLALVYDVTTGAQVKWAKLLPPTAKVTARREPGGLAVDLVQWPLLLEMEQKAASEDCADVFRQPDSPKFILWLDAGQDAVMFAPAGLPHYNSAMCGNPVSLSEADARRAGVASEVVDALAVAKIRAR